MMRPLVGRAATVAIVSAAAALAVVSASAAPEQRAQGSTRRVVEHATEVIFARGQVQANGMGTQAVPLPLDVISGATSPARVDVIVGVLLFNFDGVLPKKQFKSMTVELRRNGATVAQRSTKLKAKEGGGTLEFSKIEVNASDQLEAAITFQGGSVRDTLVALNASVASADR